MKRSLFFILFVWFALQLSLGQDCPPAVTGKHVDVWNITSKTAGIVPSSVDTTVFKFPNETQINNYSIASSYNGTWGSPLQSKIYFDRTEDTDFLFSRPYDAYFISSEELPFFNTKTPYANLTWLNTGSKLNKEDDFRALFSMNANKKLNFTGLFNYMEGRGLYEMQAAKVVKAGLWSTYNGRYYAFDAAFMYHGFDNEENGGVEDPAYVNGPDSLRGYDPVRIPIRLSGAISRYRNKYFYFNQKVNLINKTLEVDSLTTLQVPILSIAHNLKIEQAKKRYLETSTNPDFYANNYFNNEATNDSAAYFSVRNTVALMINEGFTKWFPLGITAYAGHEYREYYNLNDSTPIKAYENDNLYIGAEMAKRKGDSFLFDVNGELYMLGPCIGDFALNGNISSGFRLWGDSISFRAKAFVNSKSPLFFENNYVSNHFQWANDFGRTYRSHIEASLAWQNKWIEASVGAGVENITDLVYFNREALPQQHDGNIQVLTGTGKLDFNIGIFHLHNKVVYQKSSAESVLPLPELASYNNLFVSFRLFKVLTTQIGADMYYHTSYYAPSYMPATGVFYMQDEQKIGNYPLLSGYLNFHLKTARFFVKYYHFNSSFSGGNYFSMPNYPLYQARIQIGLSWNFFD